MPQLDLSVFETDFDPHNRTKQCLRLIRLIQANQAEESDVIQKFNKNPLKARTLMPANQETLLDFAAHLIQRMKHEEITYHTFEKNLNEAWNFCLYLDKGEVRKCSIGDVDAWWNSQMERYLKKEISWETIKKLRTCLIIFFQSIEGLPPHKMPLRVENVRMPKRPKERLDEVMPTQNDIKQLIEAVYEEGKRYTIRDQAIFALANDTGARISEILSVRNKHIREEENYLIISFPESKTKPRTVISIIAKPFLENWAKVSPNKAKGPEVFFFCQKDGSACSYALVAKSLRKSLEKTKIPWKERKGVHYFRSLCSSRFFEWPYSLKHAWFGWSYRDNESVYTKITHRQFIERYVETLQKERNPFWNEELPYWSEKVDDVIIEKLLQEDDFKYLLKKLVRNYREST